jgi:transposase-like protein
MATVYSESFKEQALAKVYRRGDRTIQAVAEELNLSVFTLKGWMKKTLPTDQRRTTYRKEKRPEDWRPEERLLALQESHGLEGEALHAWCREKGLFSHQLAQWKADFCGQSGASQGREGVRERRALQEENQRLQRELTRKEKALAEAAALLVLQKKYQALLGGEVE